MYEMTLIGNLTQDPVVNQVEANGTVQQVCSFTIGANEGVGDRKRTIFVRVSVWNKMAENCANYLRKGREVYVHGEPRFGVYNANDGSTRINIDLRADNVKFLGMNAQQPVASQPSAPAAPETAPTYSAPENNGFTPIETNELPF